MTILADLFDGPLRDFRAFDKRLSVFYTEEERALWWYRTHPQLEYDSPIVAMLDDRHDEVGQILDRLESDVFL